MDLDGGTSTEGPRRRDMIANATGNKQVEAIGTNTFVRDFINCTAFGETTNPFNIMNKILAVILRIPSSSDVIQSIHPRPFLLWRLIPALLVLSSLLTVSMAETNDSYSYSIWNGSITINKYIGPGGNVTIPDKISDIPVTRIGPGFCFKNTNITSVTLPDNVTEVREQAFAGCTSLTNIFFGHSAPALGNGIFAGCSRLTSVSIPNGITSLGYGTFTNCASLTNITLPNTLTSIGIGAFSRCASLTHITLPGGITTYGSRIFDGSSNLVSVYFEGNAPVPVPSLLFTNANQVTVYYRPETFDWESTFADRPTAIWWMLPPSFLEWSRAYYLPCKYPDASAEIDDPDHDGMNNLQELQAGTDPTKPKSVLKLDSVARPNDLFDSDKTPMRLDQYALYLQTVPGKQYLIQSVNAFGGEWQNVTNVTATTTQKRILVRKPLDHAFYRVVLVP